jgi:hypothetical protein
MVFSGTITAVGNEETGVTYPFGDYGDPNDTPLISSGILRAFDTETGKDTQFKIYCLGARRVTNAQTFKSGMK